MRKSVKRIVIVSKIMCYLLIWLKSLYLVYTYNYSVLNPLLDCIKLIWAYSDNGKRFKVRVHCLYGEYIRVLILPPDGRKKSESNNFFTVWVNDFFFFSLWVFSIIDVLYKTQDILSSMWINMIPVNNSKTFLFFQCNHVIKIF